MKIGIIPLYGIGDTLLTTPALRALKESLKNVEITYFTFSPGTFEVLKYNPYVDHLIYYPFLKVSKVKALKFLLQYRGKFDVTINFYPSNRVHYNVFAFLLGARERVGHYYLKSNLMSLNFLKNVTVKEDEHLHVVEENYKLIELLGVRSPQLYPLQYFLQDEEIEYADSFLSKNRLHGKILIGFHPGTSPLKNHEKRRWPVEYFGELARLIIESSRDFHIMVFGGKDEEDLKLKIIKMNADSGRITAVTTNSIRETAAIMKYCKIFVSNDSGLMHLAAAVNIPVVAIFGPTNPAWVKPWMTKHKVVSLKLPCSPCFYYSPKPLKCVANLDFKCLKALTPGSVFNAFQELLEETI